MKPFPTSVGAPKRGSINATKIHGVVSKQICKLRTYDPLSKNAQIFLKVSGFVLLVILIPNIF